MTATPIDPPLVRSLRLKLAHEREKNDELRCELMVLAATLREVLDWYDRVIKTGKDFEGETISAIRYLQPAMPSLVRRSLRAYEKQHPEDAKRKRARS